MTTLLEHGIQIQAFLDFRNFRFKAVDNSILFSFPLVLLSNFDLRGFCFRGFFLDPHINSVNRGMPVFAFFCLCNTEIQKCGHVKERTVN